MLIAPTPGPPVPEAVHHRIGVRWRGGCRDLFRIQFQNEYIFIHFPYQPNVQGIVTRVEFPVGSTHTYDVTDRAYGMTCKIKYNHPIDGRAHFSQTKGIVTTVRNKASRLDSSAGHFFTLDISGISSFRPCKESDKTSSLQFSFDSKDPVDPLHIFGHWIRLEDGQHAGDLTNLVVVGFKDGPQRAIVIAPPKNSLLYGGILALFASPGPHSLATDAGNFRLSFLGGFATDLDDVTTPSSYMVLLYPADISGLQLIDFPERFNSQDLGEIAANTNSDSSDLRDRRGHDGHNR